MRSPKVTSLSRRGFCLCCVGAAASAATSGWLTPRQAYAEARGIVSLIKDSAASSPITTYKLRGNISVLEGSGGNIAVLTGPDGKLLIDAGRRVGGVVGDLPVADELAFQLLAALLAAVEALSVRPCGEQHQSGRCKPGGRAPQATPRQDVTDAR